MFVVLTQIWFFRLMRDNFHFPYLTCHLWIQAWITVYCLNIWRKRMGNHQSSKLRGLWLESRHSISALHTDRNQTFCLPFLPHPPRQRCYILGLAPKQSGKVKTCWGGKAKTHLPSPCAAHPWHHSADVATTWSSPFACQWGTGVLGHLLWGTQVTFRVVCEGY